MKFLYLYTCFLFLARFTLAQPPAAVIGPAIIKPHHPVDVEMMGYSEAGVYVVHKKAPSGNQFSPTIVVDHLNARQEITFCKSTLPC